MRWSKEGRAGMLRDVVINKHCVKCEKDFEAYKSWRWKVCPKCLRNSILTNTLIK